MLKEGDKAPSFNLETDVGGRVSLRDFADQTLVLYFYPRDSTPGCTRQAQGFTAAKRAIETAGATVLGISRDSLKSHQSFRQKYELGIPLASDPDLAVHKAYGAWGEKTMYGKKIEGVLRTTFVIQDGRIARIFQNVKVDGHADAVLQSIGELSAGGPSSMRIATKPPNGGGITKGAGEAIATLARLAGEMVKSVAGAAAKRGVERAAKAMAAKPTPQSAKPTRKSAKPTPKSAKPTRKPAKPAPKPAATSSKPVKAGAKKTGPVKKAAGRAKKKARKGKT